MTRSGSLLFVTLSLLCASSRADEEQPKPAMVVLALVAEHGIAEGIVRLLNELMLTQMARTDRYSVIGSSDIQAMLSNEQHKHCMI